MSIALYTGYIIAGVAALAAIIIGCEIYFKAKRTKTHDRIDEIKRKLEIVSSI